jgi:hypothetical protein
MSCRVIWYGGITGIEGAVAFTSGYHFTPSDWYHNTFNIMVFRNVLLCALIKMQPSNPCMSLGRPLRFQEVEAPHISRQSAHEGGKVVSPTHRPPVPLLEISLVLTSVIGWIDPMTITLTQRYHWSIGAWCLHFSFALTPWEWDQSTLILWSAAVSCCVVWHTDTNDLDGPVVTVSG